MLRIFFWRNNMVEKTSPEVSRIGEQIIREDDLKIMHTINDEGYELTYPNPNTRSMIEVQIQRRFDGMPRESFPVGYQNEVIARTTVEMLYDPEKCPDWFEPWTCYDFGIVLDLYQKYVEFNRGFQKRVSDRKFSTASKSG